MLTLIQYLGATSLALVVGWAALGALASFRRMAFTSRLRSLELQEFRERLELARNHRKKLEANVAPWIGFRKFRVSKVVDECDGVKSFHLRPHDRKPIPDFAPGQFLTFQLDIPGTPGKTVRCYSLSDRHRHDHYRVTIKKVPDGLASGYFHDQVREGDILDVKAPHGGFTLDVSKDTPVVLIAGGVGITPVFSMLKEVVVACPTRPVRLFYGVRNSREHIMKEELENIARDCSKVDVTVCYSSPLAEDTEGRDFHHSGRVSLDLLKEKLGTNNFDFYICGPAPMMTSMVEGLLDWGAPKDHVHKEAFGAASVRREQPKEKYSIIFSRSDKRVAWDGEQNSLLDLAEAKGIDTIDSSGCHAGSCGACKVAIKSGKVSYNQDPDVEIEEGSCLTCIATPASDIELDA